MTGRRLCDLGAWKKTPAFTVTQWKSPALSSPAGSHVTRVLDTKLRELVPAPKPWTIGSGGTPCADDEIRTELGEGCREAPAVLRRPPRVH